MPDPITGIIAGGASILGGAQKARSASKAADAQTQAAMYQADISKEMYDQTRKDLAPYSNIGLSVIPSLLEATNPINRQQALTDYFASPEYALMGSQQNNSLLAAREATGGLGAGTTGAYMGGISNQLGMGHLAALEGQKADRFNMLSSLAGMGQSAAAQQGASGQTYASQAGQAYNQMGQAQAQSALAQGNAINNVLGNLAGGYIGYQMGGF
tara:strand:- start:2431 stop:3069 length:639 start_codon:yes stop_codon:yes gene_type:complete